MVREALAAELGRDLCALRGERVEVREELTLAALGLDSADVLSLIADLEDRHDIVVPLNDLGRIRTFGEMLDHLLPILNRRSQL